jgi:hypothetical protein
VRDEVMPRRHTGTAPWTGGARAATARGRSFYASCGEPRRPPWELAVETYRLEERREQALARLDASLCAQKTDPTELRLAEAHKRLDDALMEKELLRERCRRQGIPLLGMSKR